MSEPNYVNVNNVDVNTQKYLELQVLEKCGVILEPIRSLKLANIQILNCQRAGRLKITSDHSSIYKGDIYQIPFSQRYQTT